MANEAAVSRLGEGDAEGGAPRGRSEPAAHHGVPYFFIFYCLIVLTIATVAVAFMHFGSEWYNVGIALLIASIKGGLVAAFFMHLKYEGKLIWLALLFPILLTIILIAGIVPDVALQPDFNDTIAVYDQK